MGDKKTTNTTGIPESLIGGYTAETTDEHGNRGLGGSWKSQADANQRSRDNCESNARDSDRESSRGDSGKSSSSDWFSFGSSDNKSSDRSPEPESTPSSSGGYSGGGGDWSGSSGGGSRSSTNKGSGCLLGILGAIVIGGLIYLGGKDGKMSASDNPYKKSERKITCLEGLEENVNKLGVYLKENNKLEGKFEDYKLVMPPHGFSVWTSRRAVLLMKDGEIAFYNPKLDSVYVFESSDWGATWKSDPPIDPPFFKLEDPTIPTTKER